MLHTQIRSFFAVAQEGGFTAASKILHVGQPTITTQVKALEEYYGVELFIRQGRHVKLTTTGRDLYALCRRIFNLESEVKDFLNATGSFQLGRLTIGAVGPYHVVEMLKAFRTRYPGIELQVLISNSRQALDRLLDFEVDLAVLAHVADDPRIYAMPYSQHPVVIFVSSEHRLFKKDEVSIFDLQDEEFVLREQGSTTRMAFEEALSKAGVSINPNLIIGSREAVWMAVQRGMGIGVVSDIEFIPHPKLKRLKIMDAEIFTFAHVVCLRERLNSRLIKTFLGVINELK